MSNGVSLQIKASPPVLFSNLQQQPQSQTVSSTLTTLFELTFCAFLCSKEQYLQELWQVLNTTLFSLL